MQKWLEVSVLCSVSVTALNLILQFLFRSLAVWPLNVPWQSIDTEKHGAPMDPWWSMESRGHEVSLGGVSGPAGPHAHGLALSRAQQRQLRHGPHLCVQRLQRSPGCAGHEGPEKHGKNKEPKLLAKQKPSGNQWKLRGNQWKSCKICIIYHSIDGKSLPKKHLFIWPYQNCHGCVINRRPNQLG